MVLSFFANNSYRMLHVEKIKKLRKQNFKGGDNNMQLDSEETQRSDFSSYLISKLM